MRTGVPTIRTAEAEGPKQAAWTREQANGVDVLFAVHSHGSKLSTADVIGHVPSGCVGGLFRTTGNSSL